MSMPHFQPVLPKIPCFSGDEPKPKGEMPYIVWWYEVACLLIHPDSNTSHVLTLTGESPCGKTRIMIIPLGQTASLQDILFKIDIMFSEAST